MKPQGDWTLSDGGLLEFIEDKVTYEDHDLPN